MLFFKYLFVLSLGATFLAPGPPAGNLFPPGEKTRWIVQKTSTLSINGRTNINRFSCTVNEYTEPDTITCLKSAYINDPQGIPLTGVLRINIEDFNCRNRMMTGEFKKTLKSKLYPQLKILFINLEKMPFSGNDAEIIKGNVDIELAGISRRFEIAYTSCGTDASGLQLVGSRTFGFSDFQLQPPQKMGGLVRVNDRLNVQFILYLKQTD